MSSDGFANQILAGTGTLFRQFIKSVDYVTNVSGWRITRAGSAEFNDVSIRGSLTVPVGAGINDTHIVITDATHVPAALQAFYSALPAAGTIKAAMIGYLAGSNETTYQYRVWVQPAAGAIICADGVVVAGNISELTRQRDFSYGVARNNNGSGSQIIIGPDTPQSNDVITINTTDILHVWGNSVSSGERGIRFTTARNTAFTTGAQAMILDATAANFVWEAGRVYEVTIRGRIGTNTAGNLAIFKLLRGTNVAASVAIDFGGYKCGAIGDLTPINITALIANTGVNLAQQVQLSLQSSAGTVTHDGLTMPRSVTIKDVGWTTSYQSPLGAGVAYNVI
jgi:hypothetical protein